MNNATNNYAGDYSVTVLDTPEGQITVLQELDALVIDLEGTGLAEQLEAA